MENQTCFNLNAAVENWRTELAAQPGLSAENRRELETHLRDTFAELKGRGLSEEESFWLARRRVGQPEKLAAEFVKADPTQAWRKPMFWLVLTLLAIRLSNVIISSVAVPFSMRFTSHAERLEDWLPQWVSFYLPAWVDESRCSSFFTFLYGTLYILGPLPIAFLFIRGKNQTLKNIMDFILESRIRFLFYLLALVMLNDFACSSIWNALTTQAQFNTSFSGFFLNQGFGFFCLITLAVWLMPKQNRPTPKRF
jgi:hypothetical protein